MGKHLYDNMLDWYLTKIKRKVWLGTAVKTRIDIFFLKAGW